MFPFSRISHLQRNSGLAFLRAEMAIRLLSAADMGDMRTLTEYAA